MRKIIIETLTILVRSTSDTVPRRRGISTLIPTPRTTLAIYCSHIPGGDHIGRTGNFPPTLSTR